MLWTFSNKSIISYAIFKALHKSISPYKLLFPFTYSNSNAMFQLNSFSQQTIENKRNKITFETLLHKEYSMPNRPLLKLALFDLAKSFPFFSTPRKIHLSLSKKIFF